MLASSRSEAARMMGAGCEGMALSAQRTERLTCMHARQWGGRIRKRGVHTPSMETAKSPFTGKGCWQRGPHTSPFLPTWRKPPLSTDDLL